MIKNIIFDLGAVLLNIDFKKTIEAFRKLGITNIDELFSEYSQKEFFDSFEKGLITPQQFRAEIRKYLQNILADEDIDDAWNGMILYFPIENINLLISLKSKYRTFLLSNTNETHYIFYNKILQTQFKIDNLSNLFEKAYYSHKLGLRKPDKEIFNLVLKENNLIQEETLFIDDNPRNIATASTLGINTVLLKPPKILLKVLHEKELI
ncbi:MAG: HAD family phosphatase [Bacteroidetes bacterium]|nr:HAD family phosphatase [Bacteroidota bacterium]